MAYFTTLVHEPTPVHIPYTVNIISVGLYTDDNERKSSLDLFDNCVPKPFSLSIKSFPHRIWGEKGNFMPKGHVDFILSRDLGTIRDYDDPEMYVFMSNYPDYSSILEEETSKAVEKSQKEVEKWVNRPPKGPKNRVCHLVITSMRATEMIRRRENENRRKWGSGGYDGLGYTMRSEQESIHKMYGRGVYSKVNEETGLLTLCLDNQANANICNTRGE